MHARLVLIAMLAVALVTACAHRPGTGSAPDDEGLRQRQSDFLAALSARDLERTAALFAEDAVIHVADMPPLQGRDAIRRFYGNVFRFLSESASTPGPLRVSASADMAYGTGRVTNVFDAEQGRVEYTGKYLLVWERRGSEWWVAFYGLSSDRPGTSR
jgi:ketosteroid isomerase-like protein